MSGDPEVVDGIGKVGERGVEIGSDLGLAVGKNVAALGKFVVVKAAKTVVKHPGKSLLVTTSAVAGLNAGGALAGPVQTVAAALAWTATPAGAAITLAALGAAAVGTGVLAKSYRNQQKDLAKVRGSEELTELHSSYAAVSSMKQKNTAIRAEQANLQKTLNAQAKSHLKSTSEYKEAPRAVRREKMKSVSYAGLTPEVQAEILRTDKKARVASGKLASSERTRVQLARDAVPAMKRWQAARRVAGALPAEALPKTRRVRRGIGLEK